MLKAAKVFLLGLLIASAGVASTAEKPGSTKAAQEAAAAAAASQAADAETARVDRIKQQIKDGRNQSPVLDKLGPYLGKDY